MIRRARLSFKPNVRPSGRSAGQGSASGGQDEGGALPAEPLPDPGKDTRAAGPGEGGTGAPVTEEPVLPPPKEESKAEPVESAATVSDETPPIKTPSAPLQRRKRISTLPNLAKPRVSNSASDVVPKVSQADVPSMPPVTPAPCKSDRPEKGKVLSSQKLPAPLSPPPQGQHVTLPEKRTPVPHVPQFSPYKKSVLKPQEVSPAKPVEGPQKEEPSPLKERPSQKSCTNELYEVVKPVRKTITSNLERERLRRAQKLRELLKAELQKERKAWRAKHPIINPLVELEKSKMTMRDFVHFIPESNPMSSSLEESPSTEKSFPVESQVSGLGGKDSAEDDLDDDDEEADDSQMLAPRVKVAEDGSIILDEESLTVEVSRNKAPVVEGNDPIFERGSTVTYSSFRKMKYSKPWSDQETDMFFLAISMVGTDFSMIGQLFPHRERIEIKNKFKKEERVNGWRIDKAFREKRDFDFKFFAELLEKALEAGKKKKTRSQQPRKTSAKSRKKQKGKAAAEQSLCDEESIVSEEEGADARTAEKENNRSLDGDECSAVAEPAAVKKKRAKRKKDHAKEPNEENQESQDDYLTQMPKKKSKSKITAQDTDNRPELQSVDGDGNLKEPLAEKKTRVQKHKPNYKESELEDDEDDADFDITEEFEPDDVDLPCKAGEADVSSQSVAVTCEEETSLVLFTEESDCQSGLDDLSGLHHSLSEIKEAASQPSDVSLVGEAEPMMDVTQEETSPSGCNKVDGTDAGSGLVDEQDSEHKDKQKVPQGRRARPAPNLSRASVKKVSAEEQSDTKQQTESSDDVEVGKSDEKIVQEDVSTADPLMETDKAANLREEPSTPPKPSVLLKGRFQRPRPNLSRAAAKRDRMTSPEEPKNMPEGEACVESASEPDDTTSDIPVKEAEPEPLLAKSNTGSSITEKVSMTLEKHDDGGFRGTSVDSNPTMTVKEESASIDKTETSKPVLPKGRFQRPKPNLNKSVTRSAVTAPPEPPVQKEEKKTGATSTDNTDPSMSVAVAVLSDGDAEIKSTVEDTCDQSLAQTGKAESSSDDKKETSKPILTKGRFQKPKPNLNKSVARSAVTAPSEPPVQKEEKKTGATSTDNTDPSMSVAVAVLSDGDAEIKSTVEDTCDQSLAQTGKVESSSDDKKETSKPILTKGRFQKPKPNLNKSVTRSAVTAPPEPPVQKEEKKTGATSTDNTDPSMSVDVAVLSAGDAEMKSSPVEDLCDTASAISHAQTGKVESASDDKRETSKPILTKGRFQKPKPNLNKSVTRSAVTAPPEPPVQKEEKKTGATSTDNTPLNMSVDVDVSDGAAEMKSSPVEDPCDTVSAQSLVQAGKEESASDDKRETSKPILTKGRFQRLKPNLNKSVTRSAVTAPPEPPVQKEEKKTGPTSTDNTDPNMSVDVAVLSAGDAEMKSKAEDLCDTASVTLLAQTGKEESASDDTKTSKPILTKGRFQKPKPNLNKSVTRSAVTAPPEPPVQKEEKKTGATSTDNTDPNISVDVAVLSAGDVEVKPSTAEDPCDTASDTSLAQTGKEESASDDTKETSKPVLTKGRFQKPKPNLNKSVTRSAVTAPPEPPVQKEEKKTGATSTDNTDPSMSVDVAVLSDGDAEMKSTVEDTCDKAFVKSRAQSEEAISDAKQGEAEALKPVRARFPKPSPNLVRAAMRKETPATKPKIPEKGQETKVSDKNPELLKTEDILGTSIAGHGGKETEHGTEEKSAIKPAQLKRGRLFRPVPNLVKQSPKTLSSSPSKTNEDVNGGAPALKNKEHVVATSSPASKRKALDCDVDGSPKRLCPSGTPQKHSCLPDSEVAQSSLTSKPQSSGRASIVQDTATPQRSKCGRPLKKLSTVPVSASPKSENSSACPEKEKAPRNVKSSTTKILKPVPGKSKGKTTLVKIRATQQEEDDDEDDADPGFEEESYDLAPDMQNQAPVFVPFSLRSPRPVPAEIEETVEELEILVDAVDLPSSASLDLGETPFQHVVDPQAEPDKKGQYDGSAEAAMTLISMGSSVYKTNIEKLLSPDPCRENDISSPGRQSSQEPLTGLKLLLSPSRNFLLSPHHDACGMESSITVDTRTVEDSHSDPNLENKNETNVTRSDLGSAENLPNPINDNLTFPVEQISYPVSQQDFNSQDVGASDGLLEGHDTGEEATFILTLVEIPINDDYAYSCDSSMAESLPAPVLISSGSSKGLTQDLNPSLETVHGSSETIGQEDKDLMFGESSEKRSARRMDEEDHPPLQEKPLDSEQVVDLEIKTTACEVDGDGKPEPELSVPEPKPEEPSGVSQISATPERPPYWPVPKPSATVPVEMPGTSSDSLNRNLPLVYANSVTTSKTTLKRPGKKPLGFLSLVCKEKQSKKANVENKKKKNLPTPKCRKTSPTVHGPQKGSPDVNVENDSEVPSSSSSAEMESAASQNALPSISQISDIQDTELEMLTKSPDVATEEEAAPVSEYFFSDIFMEVDD